MPLTNTDVDAAIPVAGIPSRSLTNAALKTLITDVAAKAESGHSHSGLAPTGGTAGQVLKKIDGTAYNYSWQDDATGSGGTAASQAEAEAGVENTKFMTALRSAQAITSRAVAVPLTGYTAGANTSIAATDTILAAFGKTQGQLNAKADLLTPFAETGTSFTILNATHARDGTATNAAAITASFDFTGMPTGASGAIRQGGAGVVTLSGAPIGGGSVTYSYAPGVTASPTTAGLGGTIAWTYLGGTSVLIEYRSQTSAGGSSNTHYVSNMTEVVMAADTTEQTLRSLTVPLANIELGSIIETVVMLSRATSPPTGVDVFRIYFNGTLVQTISLAAAGNRRSRVWNQRFFVTALAANVATVKCSTVSYPDDSEVQDGVIASYAGIDISAGLTVQIRAQKGVAGETVTLNAASVTTQKV
jgi:hypothetical protein